MDVYFPSPSEIAGEITAPRSKSYTHRAYLTALVNGGGTVRNPLSSDDTNATRRCLEKFNASVSSESNTVTIDLDGPVAVEDTEIDVGESGTLLRFLLPLLSVIQGNDDVTITGRETLRNRSNRESIDSLNQAGLRIEATGEDATIPITSHPGQVPDEQPIPVACSETSQLLSGWLIALTATGGGRLRRSTELVSAPYVTMTEQVLVEAGVSVAHPSDEEYEVSLNHAADFDYSVPGDFSSAAFLIVAAALAGNRVVIDGLMPDDPQADSRIVTILQDMGADMQWKDSMAMSAPRLIIEESFRPEGFNLDASDCPDLVPILAVLGALSDGSSEITNIEHLKNKESDRINRTAEELKKVGYTVETSADSFRVGGNPDRNNKVALDAHGDHRLAMAFSILGLVRGKLLVRGADCVSKSYPNFYDDLQSLDGTFQSV